MPDTLIRGADRAVVRRAGRDGDAIAPLSPRLR